MSASKIPDAQWRKIFAFLKGHPNVYAGKQAACRHFVEGVHWILRTGAQWRELPERHGNWNSVYKRFARWEENGVWEAMHLEFAQDPDMDSVIPDTTVIRAHMCAAGGSKKRWSGPTSSRSKPRRVQYQNPPHCRCLGQSPAFYPDTWATS